VRRALLVTQRSGLTPDHPAYGAAGQELDGIEEAIARQSAKLMGARRPPA
jgi:hypothetical protein